MAHVSLRALGPAALIDVAQSNVVWEHHCNQSALCGNTFKLKVDEFEANGGARLKQVAQAANDFCAHELGAMLGGSRTAAFTHQDERLVNADQENVAARGGIVRGTASGAIDADRRGLQKLACQPSTL